MLLGLVLLLFATLTSNSSANNSGDLPECTVNDDCALDRVCSRLRCVDPCGSLCGPHTVCHVTSHVAMCSCAPGYTGNPALGCSPSSSTVDTPECVASEDCAADRVCARQRCVDPCLTVCGPHTVCHVDSHVAMCSCAPGYTGHPALGCSVAPDVPDASGCRGHDQCPSSKVCVQGSCVDPCDGLCGDNTTCAVYMHIPACACKDGYVGNPFVGCSQQVASATSAPPTTSVSCWPPTQGGKKIFYLENSVKANWIGAYLSCLRNHSRLASIESMEEMEEVRRLIRLTGRRHGQFWTAGSDDGFEGHYVWATTGRELSPFSDLWLQDPSQPDNWANIEHCVEVWERFKYQGYGLNDRLCSDKVYHICEYYE